MDKQARLAMYRAAIITGAIVRDGEFDAEKVEADAMDMLRAEAWDVTQECDAGPCIEPKEAGSRWCKGHGGRS